MPELQDPNVDWDAFYSDYMRAYLERDVRDLISVKDEANLRDVWFYRDSKKREIDLVIQDGHTLHPVEVKTNALVKKDAVKNFSCLEGMADYEVGFGHVICQAKEPYLLTEKVEAVPVWAI
ncbi:MAG: DUF4143 domain-containing protein [Coriobacteriia bacterium]|nr:DUF4143 domain-containing protein [Coriobacteriia bacterium]